MESTDRLSASLQQVREASRRLNEITDRAAETVRAVEEFLNEECSVGVYTVVPVSTTSEDVEGVGELTWYTQLCYARVGQRYRVAVVQGDDFSPGEDAVTPWSDCKRDVKLETFTKLPELVAAVAAEVNKKVADADHALAIANRMLSAVRK